MVKGKRPKGRNNISIGYIGYKHPFYIISQPISMNARYFAK